MDAKDFTGFLQKALPWIGAAATGNVPLLVAMAAKTVGDALGTEIPATPEGIGTAVANATPEQIIALKTAEQGFQERMQAMGFAHVEEMAKIALARDQENVKDVADARLRNATNPMVFRIAIVILLTFAVIMAATLYGCFALVTGTIAIKDAAVVAAVAGLVGSVVGYVAANAQTVINFLFGGALSQGNHSSANAIADAVKGIAPATK